MAVLQTLRTKFGLAISIIVALGLLSFIIDPGQIQSAVQSMSSKFDVGEINGKSISYTDFQEDIERFSALQEMMTGRSAASEEEHAQIRDAAWQSLVDKYLFVKNAKAAGINVGEAEMVALTTGDMVSPIISQNMMFQGENGYDPNNLVDFVKGIDSDESGRLQMFWNYLQNTVLTQQYYAKYGSLFNSANFANALQVEDAKAAGNATANIDYVLSMYPMTEIDST